MNDWKIKIENIINSDFYVQIIGWLIAAFIMSLMNHA